MPYSDSNPERRNLVVTSLSIIVFYAADGSLTKDTVNLPMVNVEFSKPEVLVYFVWLIMFYFLLRYWQTNTQRYYQNKYSGINGNEFRSLIIWYVKKRTNLPYDVLGGFGLGQVNIHGSTIQYSIVKTIDERNSSKSMGPQKNVDLDGFCGWIIRVIFFLYATFTKPHFTTIAIPYLLCLTAIVLGLFNCLDTCYALE
jgi:hypothetical protein